MFNRILLSGLAWLSLGTGALRAETNDAYVQEVEEWRASRLARLTSTEGWLTLIGLHFLEPEESTVGRADDNKVKLAAGPDHLGTVTLEANGRVKLQVNPGLGTMVDGREVLSAELAPDISGKPTLVTCGTLSFYVIERGGKLALRVKDSAAERRTNFAGIDYYPIDPTWRIEARWETFDRPRRIKIANILGQESDAMVLGKAVFERAGRTLALLPIQESLGEPLFFIIADETSGKETYGAARFLYADPPAEGKVVLDFNKAVNPPCAFTPFATCPLPPAENVMKIAVTAGEKDYHGEHGATGVAESPRETPTPDHVSP
ncbi:MAG: DUF1684 domain-containing protein [Cephaloticoccus sp.]|nr:DUF1684 domain-containing protein [Cephaloticoccus sp.]MCF7759032.1 DUF1684 domain-containing protein [Cephaloticoccus sp.]